MQNTFFTGSRLLKSTYCARSSLMISSQGIPVMYNPLCSSQNENKPGWPMGFFSARLIVDYNLKDDDMKRR